MTESPASLLLVLAVLLPFTGVIFGLLIGGRHVRTVALTTVALGLAVIGGIVWHALGTCSGSGTAIEYVLGGWSPPLGIRLRADGLSVLMLLAVAVVISLVSVYAHADFAPHDSGKETRAPLVFWLMLLAIWGSLNLVFVSGDLFTLYVALELLTFAGVPLVALDGRGETLRAALRYLLFALLGSLLYLLGAVLLYGAYGTLDIQLLSQVVRPEALSWAALALMTVGLLAKTALFPLHIWLPPAHAGAPAAASALLSALVVKGSWFLVLRLWFDVMPNVVTLSAAQLLAALGAAAIIVGNIVALRQLRLKLLIAYSTVAQIGYLFLMFPLAFGLAFAGMDSAPALTGGMLQTISHALAKAAMFLAAGLIYLTLGHDRISDLRGVAQALPMTVTALALAGASLIGLPPSGGFLAKWLLLSAALESGQWWWGAVMLLGGLLTSVYVFIIVVRSLAPAEAGWMPKTRVPQYQQMAVLALALSAFLLGLAALSPVDLVQLGRTPLSLLRGTP
jgi:formate hydrogenlyase subunit 3/multisubunit Na+/H+ antiporter MnhD subunit